MAKAIDLAQVTYAVPDLALMERFLTDFGLTTVSHDGQALYMRGTGHQHHIHKTLHADRPHFVGATFEVASRDDLDELAALPDSSSVEASDEPGGGWRVRMTMPDGFEIQAIWGRKPAEPLTIRAPHPFNAGQTKHRHNRSLRVKREPCSVIRLGHVVFHVRDHDESVAWLSRRFNLLASDYFLPPGENGPVIGTFLRLDHGTKLVDHHCLLVLQAEHVGVHHCSFEVQDIDSIMSAHDYLLDQDWTLECGVGRHMLGSQIFDYWRDPFGFRIEHYTDGDVVDVGFKPSKFNGTASQTTQWGMEPPLEFFQ